MSTGRKAFESWNVRNLQQIRTSARTHTHTHIHEGASEKRWHATSYHETLFALPKAEEHDSL